MSGRLGILGVGLVDPDTPLVRADDRGVLLGDGCFDSVRVRPDGEPVGLDAHLARFARSAAALDLPCDQAAWHGLVATVLAGWTGRTGWTGWTGRTGEAALRLTLTRGPEGGTPTAYATLTPVPPHRLRQRTAGVTAITLTRPAADPAAAWLLPGVKTTSYAVATAALRHAARAGADEVVFVDPGGQVLEGPTASLVWLTAGTLRTPPPDELGLLRSVTVERLFAAAAEHGLGAEERRGTPADLHAADGAWLVSAVRLAAPITALDGKPLRSDPAATAAVLAAAGL
ncbi:MAG TPA: aminotransferase class IV [Mycobacteriales bacterium]